MDKKRWGREVQLLYATLVAGKSADFAGKAIRRFLELADVGDGTPFEAIKRLAKEGRLESIMRLARTGSYTRLVRCWRDLSRSEINFSRVTPKRLERFHGIGPKTSRFFITWIRPRARFAVLDVHILRWLREECGIDAPKQTPQNQARYAKLERRFLALAREEGKTPRQLDAEIWERYRRRAGG